MTDLVAAFFVVGALTIMAMALSLAVLARRSAVTVTAACVVLVAVILGFAFFVYGQLLIVRLLPYSNAVILGNVIPPLLGALGGAIACYPSLSRARKYVIAMAIFVVAVFAAAHPVVRERPIGGDKVIDGVCIQTHRVSCAPAAAATLLRFHGIDASEAEMIDLCLTNLRGTSLLGIYRGLCLKTEDTPWRVGVFTGSVDELLQGQFGPMMISACLRREYHDDARYREAWGWIPGQPHSVVLFGFVEHADPASGERAMIGDPSAGIEQWTLRDLEVLYNGSAFYLYQPGGGVGPEYQHPWWTQQYAAEDAPAAGRGRRQPR